MKARINEIFHKNKKFTCFADIEAQKVLPDVNFDIFTPRQTTVVIIRSELKNIN